MRRLLMAAVAGACIWAGVAEMAHAAPPDAISQTVRVFEDAGRDINLSASDDGDPAALRFALLAQPAHGTVTCEGDGSDCRYVPDPNYVGDDGFGFKVTDDEGLSDTAAVTIEVVPVNDAPVARDQERTTTEDTSITITVQATDVDDSASSLTYAFGAPEHGSLSSCSGAQCTYTPAPDHHGKDTFTFTASDGSLSDEGTVTITIAPVNDPPVAGDLAMSTDEDSAVTFAAPVSDPDGETSTVTISDPPDHGTAACAATCTYTPAANHHGSDTFQITATDAAGLSDTATITMTIRPVNDAPVAQDQQRETSEGSAITVTARATDVDGDRLTFSMGSPVAPAHGRLSNCDGARCLYTPHRGYHGTDTFTFTVSDGHLGDRGTFTITIAPVNDPPVASDLAMSTDEDSPVTFPTPVSDPDGETPSIAISDQPDHGSAECAATCTYTPDPNYHGSDGFQITATDAAGLSDSATITMTVRPVNDAPLPQDQERTTTEDTPIAIRLEGTDVEGSPLAFTATTPAHGTVSCAGPDCTYTPGADYHGPDAFRFTVSDGEAAGTGVVSITVAPVNDAPVARDAAVDVDEDDSVRFPLPASDVDREPLTIAPATEPQHGTVTCGADSCTYRPAADYHGPDGFTYTATDDAEATATGQVAITVRPINDAPTASDLQAATTEDEPVTIALQGSDVDDDVLTYTTTQPSHGSVACTGASCRYTPDQDHFGSDSFTYTVTDRAGMSGTATVRIEIAEVLHETRLTAGPIVKVLSGLGVELRFRSTLTRRADGQAIGGREVSFMVAGQHACTGVTNASGVAQCSSVIGHLVPILLSGGYEAVFGGDSDHLGARARGAIIG